MPLIFSFYAKTEKEVADKGLILLDEQDIVQDKKSVKKQILKKPYLE
jgi:hypothetical protein